MQIFYYEPQRAAVHAVVRPLIEAGIGFQPVRDELLLIGAPFGSAFVRVVGHAARVPEEIERRLELAGFVLIDVDDRYPRAIRARRERGRGDD